VIHDASDLHTAFLPGSKSASERISISSAQGLIPEVTKA